MNCPPGRPADMEFQATLHSIVHQRLLPRVGRGPLITGGDVFAYAGFMPDGKWRYQVVHSLPQSVRTRTAPEATCVVSKVIS